jgi:hypothetical protein
MKTANHPVDSWPTLAEGYLGHCNNRHRKKHPPTSGHAPHSEPCGFHRWEPFFPVLRRQIVANQQRIQPRNFPPSGNWFICNIQQIHA